MAKHRLERRLRHLTRRKREIILQVAQVLALRGYHATSMRDLAQELNLNPGTLYHHFPSKDHALLEICLVGQAELEENIEEAIDSAQDLQARLHAVLEGHLAALDQLGFFVDVATSQWQHIPDDLSAPVKSGYRRSRALLRRIFDDAAASNDIAQGTDPHEAARLLTSIYRTANILHRTGRAADVRPFVIFSLDVFLHGILQPAQRGLASKVPQV